MRAPQHVFLDTSIFDAGSYNFASRAFTALIDASRSTPITLLMPPPIEAEIRRHIDENTALAVKALEDARRRAPFLAKWEQWPLTKDTEGSLRYRLLAQARSEYETFMGHLSVVRLEYAQIDLAQIMNWYENGRAPFGPGKKRKEFPDAIALCLLLQYAQTEQVRVSVVSSDDDFRRACGFHNELLFFSSLSALTEALIGAEDRVARVRAAIEADPRLLVGGIAKQFHNLTFFAIEDEDRSGEVADIDVKDVTINVVNVLNFGDHEATVAFEASVIYSAHLNFDDPEAVWQDDYPSRRRAGTVATSASIGGTAKVALNTGWTAITEAVNVTIDTGDIGVDGLPDLEDW